MRIASNIMQMRGPTIPILAMASLLLAFSGVSPAFAVGAYIAGYPDTTNVVKHDSFSARTDFTGTTTTVPRSGNLKSVFSVATFATASATDPTGWIHQQGIILDSATNKVAAAFQVYNQGNCAENCPVDAAPVIGTYGSSSGQVDYVYTLLAIYPLDVDYFWEAVTNGGGVTQKLREYVKANDGDPSNYWSVGTKNKVISGTTYKFKFYQFAVESNSEVTQTWKVKQYNLIYDAGFLADLPAKTAQFTGATHGSYITYWGTTGKSRIGGEDYNVGHANSPSAGTVDWTKGTMTPGGTVLWN